MAVVCRRRLTPRPLLVRPLTHLRTLEDECPCALGVSRREQERQGPALRLTDDGSPFAAGRVHDGPDVVHPLLERGRTGDAIRHPVAALVEQDEAAELGEAFTVVAERRELPVDVEVRVRALGVHQVDRTVAHHAVGDVHVSTACKANVGHAAEGRLTRDSLSRHSGARGSWFVTIPGTGM